MLAYFSIILFSTMMDNVVISIIVCTVKFCINYFTVFIHKTYNTIAPVWWKWTDYSFIDDKPVFSSDNDLFTYTILICYFNFTEQISQYIVDWTSFQSHLLSTVIWILNINIMYNDDQYSSTVSNIFLLQSMLTIVS